MTIRQSLETQPAGWLAGFLRAVERDNAVHVFSGCTTANHRAVVELVLWVLYEELIGPAPVLPEIRDIYELLSQMLPQLPEYLRNLMVETVQRTDDGFRVVFRDADLALPGLAEGRFHVELKLRLLAKRWRASRLEFDAPSRTAAIVLEPA